MKKPRYISTKRYFGYGGVFLLGFFLLEGACLMAGFHDPTVGAFFGLIFGGITLIPFLYYLIRGLTVEKEAEKQPVFTGTVFNWQAGFLRSSGAIIVLHGGKEYISPAFFTQTEAKEAVGTRLQYCILGETLFIFEFLPEEPEYFSDSGR